MLNQGTLALSDDLDSKTPPFSAQGLATLGAAVRKAKARRPKSKLPAKKSFLSGVGSLFGGIFDRAKSAEESVAGAFSPLIGKAFSAASALGVNLPLDRDIEALQSRKDELGDLLSEANELKDAMLHKLGTKRGPTAGVGKNIASALLKGKAAMAMLDRAQAAVQQAKSQILAGANPGKALATYGVVKALAYKAYTPATQSLRSVIGSANSAMTPHPKPSPSASEGNGRQIQNYGGMGGGGVPLNIPSEDDDAAPAPRAKKSSALSLSMGSYGPVLLALGAAGAAYILARPRRPGLGA